MGKRILNLYVDDETIQLAKAANMNISSWFREVLEIELKVKDLSDAISKEELISKLKSKIATLSTEIKSSIDTIKLLQTKIETQRVEIESLKLKSKNKYDDGETVLSF